jgi:hypothetical protein
MVSGLVCAVHYWVGQLLHAVRLVDVVMLNCALGCLPCVLMVLDGFWGDE